MCIDPGRSLEKPMGSRHSRTGAMGRAAYVWREEGVVTHRVD